MGATQSCNNCFDVSDNLTFAGSDAKEEKTAIVMVQFQNELATEGGKLHGGCVQTTETSGGRDMTREHSFGDDGDGGVRGAHHPFGADDAGEGDNGGDNGDGSGEEASSALSLTLKPTDEECDAIVGLRARDSVQRAARGGRWLEDSEMLRFVRARKTLDESEVRPTTRQKHGTAPCIFIYILKTTRRICGRRKRIALARVIAREKNAAGPKSRRFAARGEREADRAEGGAGCVLSGGFGHEFRSVSATHRDERDSRVSRACTSAVTPRRSFLRCASRDGDDDTRRSRDAAVAARRSRRVTHGEALFCEAMEWRANKSRLEGWPEDEEARSFGANYERWRSNTPRCGGGGGGDDDAVPPWFQVRRTARVGLFCRGSRIASCRKDDERERSRLYPTVDHATAAAVCSVRYVLFP